MQALHDLARQASAILGIQILVGGHRAAYYAKDTRTGYWLSREDLQYAITLSQSDNQDIRRNIYSHWRAGAGRQMTERTATLLFR